MYFDGYPYLIELKKHDPIDWYGMTDELYWCDENNLNHRQWCSFDIANSVQCVHFCFKNEEDAMAFKLRWL